MNIFRELVNRGRGLLHAGNHKDIASQVPRKYFDGTLGWSVGLPGGWNSSRDVESVSFFSPDGLAGLNVSAWSVFDREDAGEQLAGRLAALQDRPESGTWFDQGEVALAGSKARVYINQAGGLNIRWYLFSTGNVAFVACTCSVKEAAARYASLFEEILQTFSVPDRELPWMLSYRDAQYSIVEDLEVPGNLAETGGEWAGFAVYRHRVGIGRGLRLFLPRGDSGLFQVYEEVGYRREKARSEVVARSLRLTNYLAPAEQVDIQLTIELLRRAAVQYFDKTFGLRLDGTESSLEELEKILRLEEWTAQLRPSNAFLWTAGMIGAYLGELLRGKVRCHWSPMKPYWTSILTPEGSGAVQPFVIAAKALTEPGSPWLEHTYAQVLRGVWPHPIGRQTAA